MDQSKHKPPTLCQRAGGKGSISITEPKESCGIDLRNASHSTRESLIKQGVAGNEQDHPDCFH